MRYALAIALGLAILALTALVITLALNQQHLREARTELARANEHLCGIGTYQITLNRQS